MEAIYVAAEVCVVDHGINVPRLLERSMGGIVVFLTFVHKTLAMAVDLQEGLAAGVVLTHSAGEGLAAKGRAVVHITGIHTGCHQTAVEQHGSRLCIQMCTCPDSGADTIALVSRGIGAGGGHAGAQRVQLLHHVGIACIAATGQQYALGCVDADEVVVGSALGDNAGDAAVGILFQLGKAGVKVDAVALALDILLKYHVAGLFGAAVVDLLHREHQLALAHLRIIRPFGFIAGGQVTYIVVGLAFQNAGNKIVHGGRLIDPSLNYALVAATAHGAGDLAQQLGAVNRSDALFLCFAAVDGAVPVAGIHNGRILLDDAEVQSVLCSISGCAHTTVASAHNDDIGIPCLSDGSLVDVRLFAQPVVLIAGGQLHAGDHGLALCLCIAALGGLHHGVRGDGGAGNTVDLGRTGSHQLLAQLIGSGSAVGSGLAGGVHHHVGDSAVREGHGDLDGGGDALGSALVGAGGVLAGSTGSGSGSRAGGGIAGSQSTGGHTAHGGSSGDLDKALTGDLVHRYALFLFSLLVFLLVVQQGEGHFAESLTIVA